MNHPITNLESRIEQLEQSMSSSSNVLDHYVANINTGAPTILGVENQWAVIPGSEITYTMPSGTTKLIYSFDFDFGKNGETWNGSPAYDDGALSFRVMARMDSSDPDHFSRFDKFHMCLDISQQKPKNSKRRSQLSGAQEILLISKHKYITKRRGVAQVEK